MTVSSPNSEMYTVDVAMFLKLLKSVDIEKMNFDKFAKQFDETYATKLAEVIMQNAKLKNESRFHSD